MLLESFRHSRKIQWTQHGLSYQSTAVWTSSYKNTTCAKCIISSFTHYISSSFTVFFNLHRNLWKIVCEDWERSLTDLINSYRRWLRIIANPLWDRLMEFPQLYRQCLCPFYLLVIYDRKICTDVFRFIELHKLLGSSSSWGRWENPWEPVSSWEERKIDMNPLDARFQLGISAV